MVQGLNQSRMRDPDMLGGFWLCRWVLLQHWFELLGLLDDYFKPCVCERYAGHSNTAGMHWFSSLSLCWICLLGKSVSIFPFRIGQTHPEFWDLDSSCLKKSWQLDLVWMWQQLQGLLYFFYLVIQLIEVSSDLIACPQFNLLSMAPWLFVFIGIFIGQINLYGFSSWSWIYGQLVVYVINELYSIHVSNNMSVTPDGWIEEWFC